MQGAASKLAFVFIAPAARPPRPSLCTAWREALLRYFPSPEERAAAGIEVVEGKLDDVDPARLACDCLVSPANAFGIMDGGFDLALSRALQGPAGDVYALTDHVQATLRARHAGGLFAAPGTCTLVPLPGAVAGPAGNAWGARVLAVLPTMRVPADVSGQLDLAYNSMRALLGAVAAWNADTDGNEAQRIGRIVMTGLGTGTGGVSAARCARQMVLAVKHARTALPTQTRWEDVAGMMDEVAASITETASASSDASDAQA